MSVQVSNEEAVLLPAIQTVQGQIAGMDKMPESVKKTCEGDLEEEEAAGCRLVEDATLPWPGDQDRKTQETDGVSSGMGASESEEKDTGFSTGSRDLSEGHEADAGLSKAKWRESMPEGEKWRDDLMETQRDNKGDGGSLADDEEEEEEVDDDIPWISEKAAMGIIPQVKIVQRSFEEAPVESRLSVEDHTDREDQTGPPLDHNWTQHDDKDHLCEGMCSEKLKVVLATASAAVLFPFLVWGGYALLPFDSPLLLSAPLRVVYTLRCAVFAAIPIVLGIVVQGVARLHYSDMKPRFQSKAINRHVSVHSHFVNESLGLFLFFFLQLAVMATYVSQDLLKLVPLLTVVFVFGRLIYWVCLSLGSSIRGLGFGLSFFPIFVMLGANLFFVCSSVAQEAVFDVQPPTTPAPPSKRWWG
ncbi:transmembrane protein 79-like [Entelurus aequoreus]|uniref:transmembrane protein 79-like n=1 Tax=Entelurus aequoreus TaxID=161455 RepID=UPI002B1D5E49|nr:transmembrane protein 79-like [Entelurus aequoreus]